MTPQDALHDISSGKFWFKVKDKTGNFVEPASQTISGLTQYAWNHGEVLLTPRGEVEMQRRYEA